MEEKTNIYGYLDLLISNILFIVAFILFTGAVLNFGSLNEIDGEFILTIFSRWPHAIGAAGAIFLIAMLIKIIVKKISGLPISISAKSFILIFLVTYGEIIIGMLAYKEGTLY